MKNNKSPGNDELTVKFFKFFSNDLKVSLENQYMKDIEKENSQLHKYKE